LWNKQQELLNHTTKWPTYTGEIKDIECTNHRNNQDEPATPNNSTTATAGDEAVATDSNTATATDR
jgi:hypothetical protein